MEMTTFDIFNFKERLNERFFEIHTQSLNSWGRIFFFDLKLYSDLMALLDKQGKSIKRKKKMKNKVVVIDSMKETNKAINEVNKILKRFISLYTNVLKKYAKPEYKDQIEYQLVVINKNLDMIKQENPQDKIKSDEETINSL